MEPVVGLGWQGPIAAIYAIKEVRMACHPVEFSRAVPLRIRTVAARARVRAVERCRRQHRFRAACGLAVLVVLVALPASAAAAPNPGAIWLGHDEPPATVDQYARATGMVVLDLDLVDEITPRLDRLRAGGAEFLPYVSLVEAPVGTRSDWEERGRLYGGGDSASYGGEADVPSNWWWRGGRGQRRSQWPDTWMLDVRRGSAFADHAVQWADAFMRRCHCDGLFLDVLGSRLWSSAWEQMSATERSQWSAGAYDLFSRLRARLDPDGNGRPLLVANNTQAKDDAAWAGWPADGHPGLNGFGWERHQQSETPYYEGQVRNGDWHSPRRMMVISRSYPDDCAFWDARDTVDAVLCTNSTGAGYDHVPSPQTPFRPRADHIPGWTYPERTGASTGGEPPPEDPTTGSKSPAALITCRPTTPRSLAAAFARLLRRLAPREVLSRSPLSCRYRAPRRGRVSVKLVRAGRRHTLLAHGKRRFSAPGTRVVRLRLTSDGRRVLAAARRPRLILRTSFTPRSGRTVTAIRRARLR